MTAPTKAELLERLEALGQELESLRAAADEAEAKRVEYLHDLKRLAAEFENYRKRVARDQEALVARAHERLVKDLLPVLDDLERALVAASEHQEAQLEDGVRLVHRELASVLTREGLAEIETDGQFNPHVHEALLAQPSEQEEGSVIEVVQKGYRLGDRVLRPARVVVAAAPQPSQTTGQSDA
jgi:molecular chaperone GrpE